MKLFLVDGSALLYRSHFAFKGRPLTTSHGEITSAAYGFANAIVHLKEEEGAEMLVVSFDPPGKTFRHEMYSEYKAQRPPMPGELKGQIPRVHELVQAMGVPMPQRTGFEADDVLATLARRGADAGHDVWLYTGDKDFIPLIRPGISLLRPAGRGGKEEHLDERAVLKKYGVRPAQFLDMLALMGDSSDNVPGVPGIGEKTACRLIGQFGSIERLMENLEDKRVTPTLRRKLTENAEQLELSRQLVTIDQHVEVEIDWEAARVAEDYPEGFLELCRQLEFYQLLERIGGSRRPAPVIHERRVASSLEDLEAHLAPLADAETWTLHTLATEPDPMRAELLGLALGAAEAPTCYVPIEAEAGDAAGFGLFASASQRLPWPGVRDLLARYLSPGRIAVAAHDLKHHRLLLWRHGLELSGPGFDTMIASHLLAPERRGHTLEPLAADLLGIDLPAAKDLRDAGNGNLRDADAAQAAEFACARAEVTGTLQQRFEKMLSEDGLDHLMNEVEMPLSAVLLAMERRGVRLDVAHLESLTAELSGQLETLTTELHELAGEPFNLNSPKQLQVVLFDKLGLKSVKRTATGRSTDVEVLKRLADEHPLPAKLLDYRQVQKLLSTYAEALPRLVHPETGCLHTIFHQAVAATGRLSSSDPNLQNIPIRTELGRRIREAFVPRQKGWRLVSADYSQIELRLMAHLSQDPSMLAAFRDGEDIHARTAALVNGVAIEAVTSDMRRAAKAINFGILYGMGPRALGQQIGVPTKEATRFIEDYFANFAAVRHYIDTTVERARREGEVRTLLGRRRRLPELSSGDPRQKAFGERVAVNTPIQGSAADLIKVAMIRLDQRIRREELPAHLLLQVHDELILEASSEALARVAVVVREEMEGVMELGVPLEVDVSFGDNWAEAHA